MRKVNLLLLVLLSFSISAQKLPMQIYSYEGVKKVWLDMNENVYLINSKYELLKYDKSKNLIGQFSDFKLNDNSQIYTISPFKTILFYPEYGEIITFDHSLSEIARVNYFDIGLMNISTMGVSEDYQSIWVFDPVNQALTLYNQNYIKLREGEKQINMIGYPIYPSFLFVRKTNIYLYHEEDGFYIFDIFGNYIKPLPIKVGTKFQLLGNICYYIKEGTIHTIDLVTLKEAKTNLIFDSGVQDFYFSGQLLAIIDNAQNLTVYKL